MTDQTVILHNDVTDARFKFKLEPWSLRQLEEVMQRDLQMCHTEDERIMCRAICGREIRKYAEQFARNRKLTPGEIAIASKYGYR